MVSENAIEQENRSSQSGSFTDEKKAVTAVDENVASESDKRPARVVDENGKAEDLHRALTPSQISMIAIGGSIGTGLIIASGTALSNGGPAGLLIGYLVMGLVCWIVLSALGEMTSFYPIVGFTGLASRFVDPAAGVALGWSYLFKYLIITPNQLNASALLISFWRPDLSGAIFISVFVVFIICSNFCGVRWFGHFEFWMSFWKIVILTAIILGGFIISLGGNPQHDRIGFRYWTNGRAFVEYKEEGSLGRFLGVWSTLTTALFAYLGSELVGVCAGETSNPRRAIPRAIRMVIFRILFFYICGVIVIGMLVSPQDDRLVQSGKSKGTASASPFVLAIQSVQIQALPSVINGALLLFTLSAANSDLYIASRTLYGLAVDGHAPKFLLATNRLGVPYICLTIASLFCALAYLNATSGGSQTFSYLTSTVTIFGGIAWFGILLTHLRFQAGLKAHGVSRKDLPFAAPFQPYASYFAIIITSIVLIFKGFNVFWPTFEYKSFITNYIGFPVYFGIWIGYKLIYRTKFIRASEMNVMEGARKFDVLDDEINAEEQKEAFRLAFQEAPLWKKPWVWWQQANF